MNPSVQSKPRGQIFPLLRYELGFGPVDFQNLLSVVFILGAFGFANALLMFAPMATRHQIIWPNITPLTQSLWVLFVSIFPVAISSLYPLFLTELFRPAAEFCFSRAIDRRLYFRARLMIGTLVVFAPLLVGVVYAWRHPDFVVDTRVVDASAYLKAFPGSYVQPGDATNLVVNHGGLVAVGAYLWTAALLFLLAQLSYYARASLHTTKQTRVPWSLLCLIIGLPLLLAAIQACVSINLYDAFLFLCRAHPILMTVALVIFAVFVLRFCERKFSRLEIF